MKLTPFDECWQSAENAIRQGFTVYQQFLCAHCGSKQTIDVANRFFDNGICERCRGLTDIRTDGCNFAATVVT